MAPVSPPATDQSDAEAAAVECSTNMMGLPDSGVDSSFWTLQALGVLRSCQNAHTKCAVHIFSTPPAAKNPASNRAVFLGNRLKQRPRLKRVKSASGPIQSVTSGIYRNTDNHRQQRTGIMRLIDPC